jgi:uncharacterized protein YbdZ (MbtH family)
MEEHDPFEKYCVVVNHEEQYSIWPLERQIPNGWRDVGKNGTKQECLDHIEQVWTDMRPLSLRKKMEEWKNNPPPPEPPLSSGPPEISLVDRLCEGDHKLAASLRPDRTAKALLEAIDRKYVLVKFTETRGGTELGMELDSDECRLTDADFDEGSGDVRLVGGLTLDFVKVRCIAQINLATLEGTGRLEKLTA